MRKKDKIVPLYNYDTCDVVDRELKEPLHDGVRERKVNKHRRWRVRRREMLRDGGWLRSRSFATCTPPLPLHLPFSFSGISSLFIFDRQVQQLVSLDHVGQMPNEICYCHGTSARTIGTKMGSDQGLWLGRWRLVAFLMKHYFRGWRDPGDRSWIFLRKQQNCVRFWTEWVPPTSTWCPHQDRKRLTLLKSLKNSPWFIFMLGYLPTQGQSMFLMMSSKWIWSWLKTLQSQTLGCHIPPPSG